MSGNGGRTRDGNCPSGFQLVREEELEQTVLQAQQRDLGGADAKGLPQLSAKMFRCGVLLNQALEVATIARYPRSVRRTTTHGMSFARHSFCCRQPT
jgi:hypothetical protein